MEINIKHILLFKTDIRTEGDRRYIGKIMEEQQIEQWTVDLHDIDCVLRIVSPTLKIEEVIQLVVKNGYQCEVLT
jgi:tRNA G26 N,N-dimethylase Trm1